MSFGVAQLMKHEDMAAFVGRVDRTLYASKQNGRNCVHMHDGKNILRVEPDKHQAAAQPKAEEHIPSGQGEDKKHDTHKTIDKDQVTASASKAAGNTEPDLLAELPGRTNFCQLVRNRMAEWRRGGPTFSIVMLEVDHHEQVADGKIRPLHNNSIATAARYLTSSIREMDVLGNYSPGCFVLLLPTAELVNAIRVAERLREGFQLFRSSEDGEIPTQTLSVGVVQITDNDESVSLLKRAEAALDAATAAAGIGPITTTDKDARPSRPCWKRWIILLDDQAIAGGRTIMSAILIICPGVLSALD